MTKIDLSNINPLHGFDCLKWKDEIQSANFERRRHMPLAEQRADIERGAEEFDHRIAEIRSKKQEGGAD